MEKNYTDLYINGCSFTAGHELPTEQTWPVLLYKELKTKNDSLKLLNDAKNGNSFPTIKTKTVDSTLYLPTDSTLAVIGLTWETRTNFRFQDKLINITPSDLSGNSNGLKIAGERIINRVNPTYYNQTKHEIAGIQQVGLKFIEYRRSCIKYDSSYSVNEILDLLEDLILLQSYFKSSNIDYLFVHFFKGQLPWNSVEFKQYKKFLDLDKVLNLGYIQAKENSHPSAEECIVIKDEIVKKISKIYE